MGQTTIGWTATVTPTGQILPGYTFNPWIGCYAISDGCNNCYASTLASTRMGLSVWGPPPTTTRKLMSESYWKHPLAWNRRAEREGVHQKVFCASMADVFEQHPMLEAEREKLWSLIHETPALTWQLLTKRPHMVTKMVPSRWMPGSRGWPHNVWIGTSVENQHWALKRIPHLLRVPAHIRFLSVEPLLAPVDLSPWIRELQWVIVGSESGRGARPMEDDWVRAIRDLCVEHGVSFFFKQRTVNGRKQEHPLLDGVLWEQFPDSTLSASSLLQPLGR